MAIHDLNLKDEIIKGYTDINISNDIENSITFTTSIELLFDYQIDIIDQICTELPIELRMMIVNKVIKQTVPANFLQMFIDSITIDNKTVPKGLIEIFDETCRDENNYFNNCVGTDIHNPKRYSLKYPVRNQEKEDEGDLYIEGGTTIRINWSNNLGKYVETGLHSSIPIKVIIRNRNIPLQIGYMELSNGNEFTVPIIFRDVGEYTGNISSGEDIMIPTDDNTKMVFLRVYIEDEEGNEINYMTSHPDKCVSMQTNHGNNNSYIGGVSYLDINEFCFRYPDKLNILMLCHGHFYFRKLYGDSVGPWSNRFAESSKKLDHPTKLFFNSNMDISGRYKAYVINK